MSGIEEILEKWIGEAVEDKYMRKYGLYGKDEAVNKYIGYMVQELRTYISNLLDSTALENEKYLDGFVKYWIANAVCEFREVGCVLTEEDASFSLIKREAEQYKAEQHKLIKLAKEKI